MILLAKYGAAKRIDKFYSDKYFNAFPDLITKIQDLGFETKEESARRCYSIRTFDRFIDYFGLIKIETTNRWDTDKFIMKTELFDKLIKSTPHNRAGHPVRNSDS